MRPPDAKNGAAPGKAAPASISPAKALDTVIVRGGITTAGCSWCGGPLPPRRRRFCSDDHRRKGHRAERKTEDADYGKAVVRMIGGMGRRASADLYALRSLADAVDNARQILALSVDGCRLRGYSDSEIAAVLGVTRQAAWKRFPRQPKVGARTGAA